MWEEKKENSSKSHSVSIETTESIVTFEFISFDVEYNRNSRDCGKTNEFHRLIYLSQSHTRFFFSLFHWIHNGDEKNELEMVMKLVWMTISSAIFFLPVSSLDIIYCYTIDRVCVWHFDDNRQYHWEGKNLRLAPKKDAKIQLNSEFIRFIN